MACLKSKVIEEAIHCQNTEAVEAQKPSDLKLRPTADRPNCPTRTLFRYGRFYLKNNYYLIFDSMLYLEIKETAIDSLPTNSYNGLQRNSSLCHH